MLKIVFTLIIMILMGTSLAQLTPNFYLRSCPQVFEVVGSVVWTVVSMERRMGASLLRLQFHDCFVNGCDASILLDDTPTLEGEKTAAPNINSARGFEVIDIIKSNVEKVCPGVVSCADIIAITALESVLALGGPRWKVKLGRRDSLSASFSAANGSAIPLPTFSLKNLISTFQAVGLSAHDMVALTGAHTIGKAHCPSFRSRIYNEINIDPLFASIMQLNCPQSSGFGDNNLAPIDLKTPNYFDNSYYKNLVKQKGLLHSDQEFYSGGFTDSLVEHYSKNPLSFEKDFAAAMIKMGDISPLTGDHGEIRKNCRVINS
uniref:peroxidase 4-like isoform X2 n=1 Tax=Erigeron canadensis TaxID=72917 RepID=UPI001CB96FCC|nr:peroxidase 4-like isoform X2 [Erigeron canadensis]